MSATLSNNGSRELARRWRCGTQSIQIPTRHVGWRNATARNDQTAPGFHRPKHVGHVTAHVFRRAPGKHVAQRDIAN